MSDEADRADRLIDASVEQAIARARMRAREVMPYTGFCYYCGERVKSPYRWCGTECRDDWERTYAAHGRD